MPSPILDHDLSFSQGVEDFTIQPLIPKFRVEALDVPKRVSVRKDMKAYYERLRDDDIDAI